MAEVLSGGAMTAAVRPEDVRIGDRDRERATARLGRAQAEGRLDVFEYDDRLRAAYAARTYGELARVTADLPAEPVAGEVPRPVPRPVLRHERAGVRRATVAVWASASTVNLVIWAIVTVAAGAWVYPWWIWVAGPWGAMLLAGRVGGGIGQSTSGRSGRVAPGSRTR